MKRFLLLVVGLIFSGLALAAVNINTATKEELEALNGIGPVKAQAIIDYRKANGPFKSIDDVKNVKGVGDATFDKIRGDLSLSGATKLPAGAAAPAKAEPAKAAAAPAAAPAPAKAEPAKAASSARGGSGACEGGTGKGGSSACGGPGACEGRTGEGGGRRSCRGLGEGRQGRQGKVRQGREGSEGQGSEGREGRQGSEGQGCQGRKGRQGQRQRRKRKQPRTRRRRMPRQPSPPMRRPRRTSRPSDRGSRPMTDPALRGGVRFSGNRNGAGDNDRSGCPPSCRTRAKPARPFATGRLQ